MDRAEQEFLSKIAALTRQRFRGDYEMMFDHYSRKRANAGLLDRDELSELLKDADIGNFATRSTWASRVITKLDRDRNGVVAYAELKQYLIANSPGQVG